MPITVATFNIHDAVGTDGVRDIARIARAIEETSADVVALQEVSGPGGVKGTRPDLFAVLSRSFGGYAVEGAALLDPERRYGNLLLSKWPVIDQRVADLTYGGREPRTAIVATLASPAGPLRIIASHFGLKLGERWRQAGTIGGLVGTERALPTIVLGDFNDWLPFSPAVRRLCRALDLLPGPFKRVPTFPSRLPLLALDRILTNGLIIPRTLEVSQTHLGRTASDHRPLIAEIEIIRAARRSPEMQAMNSKLVPIFANARFQPRL